ncbi:MAG: DUF2252 family protein [Deltaproteobacteria bacterium]|nr:DUF2252 family protein [Deltaproteobacteria bacterium]
MDERAALAARAPALVAAPNLLLGLSGAALAEKQAMLAGDAHVFFRGTPALFVDDMQGPCASLLELADRRAPRTDVLVDFHLGNLGTFAAPDGRVVWGPNDFDQAAPGAPELDLLRGATSLFLLGQANDVPARTTRRAVRRLLSAYADELARLTRHGGGPRPTPALTPGEVDGCLRGLLTRAADQAKESRQLGVPVARYVDPKSPDRLRRSNDVVNVDATWQRELELGLAAAFPGVRVLDVAERLHAGGSSRGLPRALALVEQGGVRHVLELKRAPPSPLDGPGASFDAAQVVARQRAMAGAIVSPWLRAASIGGRSFLVREVDAEKASLDLTRLGKGDLDDVAKAAGVALARVHGHDPAVCRALHQWLGRDVDEIAHRLEKNAGRYARVVEAEHQAWRQSLGA